MAKSNRYSWKKGDVQIYKNKAEWEKATKKPVNKISKRSKRSK